MSAFSPPAAPATALSFDAVWAENRRLVYAFLLRKLHDPQAAEEVCQETAVRVWRGLPSFQGRSKVSTWILRIAEREADRWLSKKRFAALESVPEPVAKPEEAPTDWDSRQAITQAHTAGLLSSEEAAVMTARLDNPELGWEEIAPTVGQSSANNAAQAHARAMPKLRVFLMVHHPDLCGSATAIAEAFERACGGVNPLTDAEQRAFRAVVLDRTTGAKALGIWTVIQSACVKVAVHLTAEEGSP